MCVLPGLKVTVDDWFERTKDTQCWTLIEWASQKAYSGRCDDHTQIILKADHYWGPINSRRSPKTDQRNLFLDHFLQQVREGFIETWAQGKKSSILSDSCWVCLDALYWVQKQVAQSVSRAYWQHLYACTCIVFCSCLLMGLSSAWVLYKKLKQPPKSDLKKGSQHKNSWKNPRILPHQKCRILQKYGLKIRGLFFFPKKQWRHKNGSRKRQLS